MKRILFVLPVVIFLIGCATASLSTMQRRSIEAKELEGSFDDTFKATLQVLQDKGYVISHTDYKAGVIEGGTGEKYDFWHGQKAYKVTATIEQFGEKRIKMRITFLEEKGVDAWGSRHSNIVEDPGFLQKIYDNIQKEIFVRQNLNK